MNSVSKVEKPRETPQSKNSDIKHVSIVIKRVDKRDRIVSEQNASTHTMRPLGQNMSASTQATSQMMRQHSPQPRTTSKHNPQSVVLTLPNLIHKV